ncbi:flagellar basal body-associated protein FliL [Nitrosomonas sp.]|uniref:flagellar basal body-associated protein FliL n=1 Tax=Nitrosomonas sp. TaxID=42353 RepID=UPI0025EC4244|nr:flagellar basal body-associated protein FliL [Nitrosomonas sp.]MCC6916761.1 flagellar basal body-associated protein FliL [Nitrosomonas sp.]
MSEATAPATPAAPAATGSKKKVILLALTGILAIGAGVGGTWYYMKHLQTDDKTEATDKKKNIPTAFIKLESFTVNLQPEQADSKQPHYLQVELSLKVNESDIIKMIDEKKPEVRNQILLLLTSKKPSEINTLDGKQKLSQEIIQAIKSRVDAEDLKDDVLDVLFTSFIIQ